MGAATARTIIAGFFGGAGDMLKASATTQTVSSRFDDARQLFEQVALADDFADFLTLPAYAMVD